MVSPGRQPIARRFGRLPRSSSPGPPGTRFDYLTIDDDDHYLLSAHLGVGLSHVVDLRTNAVVKTARMAVVKRLPTEAKPDGIAYAAPFHKAYVSNERAKAESVIDVRTDTIVKVLRFDSETGVPQYDSVARKVCVDLQDRNMFAVIDPPTDTVVGRYPVQGCRENHGMAIDPEHHRAFLSCESNDTLTVFDLDTHQAIAHLPMAKGADVVMFDPGLGRIYVACSSGAISVFQMDDAARFRKLQDFPVEPKIHSLAVDTLTHRVYVPAEQEKGRLASKMFVFEAVPN